MDYIVIDFEKEKDMSLTSTFYNSFDYQEQLNSINSVQDRLMQTLTVFFSEPERIERVLSIVRGSSKISSLRNIDWFVTNYAKKNNVVYALQKEKDGKTVMEPFFVHMEYKAQLKAYSKKNFDPFQRRERIIFIYNENKELCTTVGQLNFFRWAIENKIIDYIENNIEHIQKDMNESFKKNYKNTQKKPNERKKRQELSESATKKMASHDFSVEVSFD